MTRDTFNELCDQIEPLVAPDVSCPREAVPTRKRVAIALYKLATCSEYRVIGETFGVSKTTVHRCVYGVCEAICSKLMKTKISLPDADEALAIAQRNYEAHKIPQVYGAIDGSHIPVHAPSDGYRDYVNRKGWTSVVLQAVGDARLMIRDICVGTPGCAHDAAVFATSHLFRYPAKHPQAVKDVERVQVPLLLAGDPAYPLLPWIMKGFSGLNLTATQETFNEHLSAIRVKVEHAFGHLKATWRVLSKQSDIDYNFMPVVVATCCVLHNICEEKRQQLPPAALHPAVPLGQRPQGHHQDQPDPGALLIREALAQHLVTAQ
ncbi:hypothetical protein ABVT39_008684 [Epinephelus coioides]